MTFAISGHNEGLLGFQYTRLIISTSSSPHLQTARWLSSFLVLLLAISAMLRLVLLFTLRYGVYIAGCVLAVSPALRSSPPFMLLACITEGYIVCGRVWRTVHSNVHVFKSSRSRGATAVFSCRCCCLRASAAAFCCAPPSARRQARENAPQTEYAPEGSVTGHDSGPTDSIFPLKPAHSGGWSLAMQDSLGDSVRAIDRIKQVSQRAVSSPVMVSRKVWLRCPCRTLTNGGGLLTQSLIAWRPRQTTYRGVLPASGMGCREGCKSSLRRCSPSIIASSRPT